MGGGKSQKSTQSTQVTLPSWLEAPLQDYYLDTLDKTRTLTDKPYEAYTGDRVSPFSADELQAFDLTRSLASQGPVDLSYAQGINEEVVNRGLNGFSQQTLDQYMNPYMTNVMDVSRGRQFDEFSKQQTALQQQQGATGAFGGSRGALAQGQLYDNFSRNLSENEALQLYQGYADSQNRAFQGTQLAGQAGMDWANQELQERQSGYQDIGALQASGQAQRGLAQTDLDVGYQDWATEQSYPYQQLQFGSSIVDQMTNLFKGQTSTTTQSGGGPSAIGTALGLASMAMGVPGIGSAVMGGLGSMASNIGMTGMGQTMLRNAAGGTIGPMQPSFKEGGKVEMPDDMMKYEENDSVSQNTTIADKINRFHEKMIEARREYDGKLKYEENDSISDTITPAYRSGGVVRGYADGGVVSPEEEWLNAMQASLSSGALQNPDNIRNVPMDLPDYELPEEDVTHLINNTPPAASGDYNIRDSWSRMLGNMAPDTSSMSNRYQSQGGLSGLLLDADAALGPMVEGVHEFAAPLVNYVKENPEEALGTALMVAPWARTLAKGASYGAKGLSALVKGLGKATKSSPKVADLLTRAGISGVGISMLNKGNKEDVKTPAQEQASKVAQSIATGDAVIPEEVVQTQSSVPAQASGLMQAERGSSTIDRPKGKSQNEPDEWNIPLIAFGASLLGSDKNFFQSLGDAAKSGIATKMSREDAIREQAQKSLENTLAQRRLEAYEMQNQIAAMKAVDPYTQMKKQADAQLAMRKLNENPEASKIFKSLMDTGRSQYVGDPQATRALALKMAGGAPTEPTENNDDPLGLR